MVWCVLLKMHGWYCPVCIYFVTVKNIKLNPSKTFPKGPQFQCIHKNQEMYRIWSIFMLSGGTNGIGNLRNSLYFQTVWHVTWSKIMSSSSPLPCIRCCVFPFSISWLFFYFFSLLSFLSFFWSFDLSLKLHFFLISMFISFLLSFFPLFWAVYLPSSLMSFLHSFLEFSFLSFCFRYFFFFFLISFHSFFISSPYFLWCVLLFILPSVFPCFLSSLGPFLHPCLSPLSLHLTSLPSLCPSFFIPSSIFLCILSSFSARVGHSVSYPPFLLSLLPFMCLLPSCVWFSRFHI